MGNQTHTHINATSKTSMAQNPPPELPNVITTTPVFKHHHEKCIKATAPPGISITRSNPTAKFKRKTGICTPTHAYSIKTRRSDSEGQTPTYTQHKTFKAHHPQIPQPHMQTISTAFKHPHEK